mmetsp:Transcript_76086/g.122905  ORF Transcript_76086/g.122905 Transcript_76086/m.122905 type:complete len:233 (+) Transcript_76086:61-759(+)
MSSRAAADRPRSRGRRSPIVLLPLCLAVISLPQAAGPDFVGLRQARAAAQLPFSSSKPGSFVVRFAGTGGEVSDDLEMIRKLKDWKANKAASAPSSTKGFGSSTPSASATPAKAPAEPPAAPAAPKIMTTQFEAVRDLLRRGQEDASPAALTPQQVIMVFFAYFSGFRERNNIAGDIDLSTKQKQMVVLMIQSNLMQANSAKDFWPLLCAELGSGKDLEVKQLLFDLTGLPN